MIECKGTVEQYGDSFKIIFPKKIIEENKIQINDKVHLLITKIDQENTAKKLWGALPDIKDSEELEKFIDKEFDIN